MSEDDLHPTERVRNKAQEEREASDKDVKKLTDTPDIRGGETWENATGHSGTKHAWAISTAMIAAALLAAGGMTFGPHVLLWIGVGLFVVLGVYGFATRAWTDYVHEPDQGPDSAEPGSRSAGRTRRRAVRPHRHHTASH
ncbi:MAG TPA: hypothetical protein VH372_16600 [Actinospica sp.]|jgi:hypothetical protein|nr:hypothetical protein [Actinospica sp.]